MPVPIEDLLPLIPKSVSEDDRSELIVMLLESAPETESEVATLIRRTRYKQRYRLRAERARFVSLDTDLCDLRSPQASPTGLVWDAVHQLPEHLRDVLLHRYVHHRTKPETAAAMGVSRTTVHYWTIQAKAAVTEILAAVA